MDKSGSEGEIMTNYIDLLAAHDKLQVELDFARHERNIMAGEVKKLASQVATLTDVLWRENPGYHRFDPCIFCGKALDDYGIGECPGPNMGKVEAR